METLIDKHCQQDEQLPKRVADDKHHLHHLEQSGDLLPPKSYGNHQPTEHRTVQHAAV